MSDTLRDLRLKNGLTQNKLAFLLGVHRNHIGKWENGKAEPEQNNIDRMTLIFKTTEDVVIDALNNSKVKKPSEGTPNVIAFRCSDSLYEKIKCNADQANLKVGTYVAKTYDGGNLTVINGLDEFYRELRQVGKNLNQLTMLANSGAIRYPDLSNLHSLFSNITIKLNQMLDEINNT